MHEHFLERVIRTLTVIFKKKRFRPEPLVSQMEIVRPRGPGEVSGEPSHLSLPRPGDAWRDAGKTAAVAWLWALCPGPAERGGVGQGVSPAPVPGGRRLCSPCGEEIYSPRSWELTEKKPGAALPKDAARSTRGEPASGWARLLQAQNTPPRGSCGGG